MTIDLDKAKYVEREFNQRQIISMMFFILRDNCHYISPEERRDLKNNVKAAQRQLGFIQEGNPGCFFGCQPSTVAYFKELYAQVMKSRWMAYRWYGTCTINHKQRALLHTNRQAIGRTIRE